MGTHIGTNQAHRACLIGTRVQAWAVNKPLSLDYHIFETVVIFCTVIIVNFVIHDGESNWLQGGPPASPSPPPTTL